MGAEEAGLQSCQQAARLSALRAEGGAVEEGADRRDPLLAASVTVITQRHLHQLLLLLLLPILRGAVSGDRLLRGRVWGFQARSEASANDAAGEGSLNLRLHRTDTAEYGGELLLQLRLQLRRQRRAVGP